jgi:hypothetical protein
MKTRCGNGNGSTNALECLYLAENFQHCLGLLERWARLAQYYETASDTGLYAETQMVLEHYNGVLRVADRGNHD